MREEGIQIKINQYKNYDHTYNFYEGLALVELNNKWEFIDKTGKEVIEIRYDSACHFKNGLALVRIQDVRYYIDQTGNIAFQVGNLENIEKISNETFSTSNQDKLKAIKDKIKQAEHIEKYYDLIIDGNRVSFSNLEEREQFEKELLGRRF